MRDAEIIELAIRRASARVSRYNRDVEQLCLALEIVADEIAKILRDAERAKKLDDERKPA